MAYWPCVPGAQEAATAHEWRLLDGHWQQVSGDPLDAHFDLDGENDVALENGTLSLAGNGSSKRLAEDILDMSAPLDNRFVSSSADGTGDSCLLGVANDLGTRSGDLDGDGKTDRIDLTLCGAQQNADDRQKLVAHVNFGDGSQRNQVLSTEIDGSAASCVGLADVTGDNRSALFIVDSAGAHAQHVAALELRNGSFVPLRGDLDANSLYVDSSLSTNSGFACKTIQGQHQLVVTYVDLDGTNVPARYMGQEETYQAMATGEMKKITDKPVSYPAEPADGWYKPPKEVNDFVGAHCAGLDVMPNR
jgi:hypothetical protein